MGNAGATVSARAGTNNNEMSERVDMPLLLVIGLIVATVLYGLSWHYKRARQARTGRHDNRPQPPQGK